MAETPVARDGERGREHRSDRFLSTVAIGACVIAAVRMARDESISKRSPRQCFVVSESITLAEQILKQVLERR